MQESQNANAFVNIHFPQRTGFIKKLRYVSFIINDVILISALIILFVWITNISGLAGFFFQRLGIFPFTSVLFLLSGASLLFGAKRHLLDTSKDAENDKSPWWHTGIPIFLSIITALFGFITVIHLNTGILSFSRISHFGGLCFFLIGLSLATPFTRIPHRFHLTQLLLFIVSGLNVFVVLENIYQLFSSHPVQHIVFVPLSTALAFVLFCFGILLRWSNRGFIGNFTLDSTGSVFALRLFLLNLISAPLIALLVLFFMQHTSYNTYQVLTVIVVLFTFISCSLLWVNIKLLYPYELEHLLMRESLRSHNIDLTNEEEDLREKMIQLEQEKKQYLDKLSTQVAWRDAADTLE